jgi:hypothetical protein
MRGSSGIRRRAAALILAALDSLARALPIGLTDADLATIHRFHQQFIDNGTGLRFQTLGRAPRPNQLRTMTPSGLHGRARVFPAKAA